MDPSGHVHLDGSAVAVCGSLDSRVVPELRRAIDALGRADPVTIDLSRAVDVDASGVEALVAAATSAGRRGRSLRISATPAIVGHVLRLGLGDIVRVRRGPRHDRSTP